MEVVIVAGIASKIWRAVGPKPKPAPPPPEPVYTHLRPDLSEYEPDPYDEVIEIHEHHYHAAAAPVAERPCRYCAMPNYPTDRACYGCGAPL